MISFKEKHLSNLTVKGSITEYSDPMVRKLFKSLLVHLALLQMMSDRCSS